jgi:hypothetical protein
LDVLGQMAVARQDALTQANQLHEYVRQMLPAENATYGRRRQQCNDIADTIGDRGQDLWPILAGVTFSDISVPEDCVIAMVGWNNLLLATLATLEQAKQRLNGVRKNKFEAFYAIQEFITELSRVISRCLMRLGQLYS